MVEGQIIEGRGGLYTVRDGAGSAYVLRAKKKFRRQRMTPLVGDCVLFTPGEGEEHGWLEEILPRKSECLRPPVANITLLVVVIAPAPAPDWLLVDKLLLGAHMQGMHTLLVANKGDLGDEAAQTALRDYEKADTPVLRLSAQAGEGLDSLRERMQGETVCFAGQSGVGKSTLLNALLGLELETGAISRIERGKHTTRHASLIEQGGLRVMDTPGFTSLDVMAGQAEELKDYYPEFVPYLGKCRFDGCNHMEEPGCAVRQAVQEGQIPVARYENYRALFLELKDRKPVYRKERNGRG